MVGVTKFITVIVPLKLEWEPVYGIAEKMLQDNAVRVGTRVSVPFSGKDYIAVVSALDVRPSISESKILSVNAILSDLAPVTENEIELWRFVSEYYMCTLGEVYKEAYPSFRNGGELSVLRSSARRAAVLDRNLANAEARILRLRARQDAKSEKAAKARKEEVRNRYLAEAEALNHEIAKAVQVRDSIVADRDSLNLVENSPFHEISPEFSLSVAQNRALDEINMAFSAGKPALLHGVTGAGKTEIYMSLAIKTLNSGKNVLYLLPEIAVSRQMEQRLKKVFGSLLHVFHSKESFAARTAVACGISSGRYIVLGTRSALLLPHVNLGLVIVDEEHDTSYKQQDPAPRYNGRDTALMLARIHGASAVLGSATPSLESLFNTSCGKMIKVSLQERYYGAEDAEVEIIDTLAEKKKRGMCGSFSFRLADRIHEVLKNGGQVLVLRARRSYSPAVQCSGCGKILKCSHCNVPLSWHKDAGVLLCHYCGARIPFDGVCPDCGGVLEPMGSGTQKIEEEASNLFPEARIARLDRDVAMKAGAEEKIIRDFSEKRTDILIGTQIITKGFDFDGLELVAVIQSDSLLGQQDFRADERAVQLLEQFRGRCGRRGRRGRFVIQTSRADHPVYSVFREGYRSGEGKALMDNMLSERKMFGYPPYSRVVEIRMKDSNEARLEKLSRELAAAISSSFCSGMAGFLQSGSVSITGPYVPAVDKVNDQHFRNIRLSMKRDGSLVPSKKRLGCIIRAFETEKKWAGHVIADVDPV